MFRSAISGFSKTNNVMLSACEKRIEKNLCSMNQKCDITKDIIERLVSQDKELAEIKKQLVMQQKKLKEILDLVGPSW